MLLLFVISVRWEFRLIPTYGCVVSPEQPSQSAVCQPLWNERGSQGGSWRALTEDVSTSLWLRDCHIKRASGWIRRGGWIPFTWAVSTAAWFGGNLFHLRDSYRHSSLCCLVFRSCLQASEKEEKFLPENAVRQQLEVSGKNMTKRAISSFYCTQWGGSWKHIKKYTK